MIAQNDTASSLQLTWSSVSALAEDMVDDIYGIFSVCLAGG